MRAQGVVLILPHILLFINKHIKIYFALENLFLKIKRVRDYLQGITDPQCNAIKLAVLSNPILLNDFPQTVNYVVGAIDLMTKNTPSVSRRIAEINSEGGRGGHTGRGYQGGRGQGRGQGRGSYGSRGRGGGGRYQNNRRGRGRGRGSSQGNLGRGYSAEQWSQLSSEERSRIYRERDRQRSVSALGTERDDVSIVTEITQPPPNNQASAQRTVASAHSVLDNISENMNRRQAPPRSIGAVTSILRRMVSSARSTKPEEMLLFNKDFEFGRAELDSHADTCAVNDTAYILEYTGITAEVAPFSQAYDKMQNIPIVKAALAYDDAETGQTYILVLNHVLYFGPSIQNILLNPNQIRSNGIVVDDVPKHLSGGDSTHSIFLPEEELRLPLKCYGCLSYLSVRRPTLSEINNCSTYELTSPHPWDPYSSDFQEQERIYQDSLESAPRANRHIAAFTVNDFEVCDFIHQNISGATTSRRKLQFSSSDLAKRWAVGDAIAEQTIKSTTQHFIRSAIHPIERRFRTKTAMLRYNRLKTTFYSDTTFSKQKSSTGNTCAQLFITDFGYQKLVPQKLKSEAGHSLLEGLIQDVGIPDHIHTDMAKELTLGTWSKVCKEHHIKMTNTEPYTPQQNKAELGFRELKRHVRRFMARTNTPPHLWDFCAVYTADLRNRLALPLPQLHGRTPHEVLTGNTPDVSEFLEFEWYQPVWYYDPEPFPEQRRKLARWIGIAHRVGQALCYWIIPESGRPLARTTIQAVSQDELSTQVVKDQLVALDLQILEHFGMQNEAPEGIDYDFNFYREDEDYDEIIDHVPIDPEARHPEADCYDELLLAEPLMPRGEGLERARIIGRKRDADGNPVGHYDPNPILNTRVYLAEFEDGFIKKYSANAIADAIYAQVDDDGLEHTLFSSIIGHHKKQDALEDDAAFVNTQGSQNPHPVRTTKGWDICIEWKDGSSSWHPLTDVRNSFPIHLAEYAIKNNLDSELAFRWWVKDALRRKQFMLSAVKTRYAKRTHKFGIRVPQSVDEALAIDKETKTTFWFDAIQKEMKNNRIAFQFLDDDSKIPVGYKWIRCHMIFDVKTDFTRKARFVAGGHMTDPPSTLTYSSVVSRDSVRIAFVLAALNDIYLLAADIGNAYLNASAREKVYTTAVAEFSRRIRRTTRLNCSSTIWVEVQRRSMESTFGQHLVYNRF
mmetsp:Transcript_24287/g.34810  ORF Transcript_24287/g.34810 Transcript_24287/m.34810 type:complete len:1184 (-) Transcript_24287:1334-4885(-)